MSKIGKGFILAGLLGFVVIGLLLLTNHWGMAIRLTNYLFFVLLSGVLYEKIAFKN